jgi:hypothetical protein
MFDMLLLLLLGLGIFTSNDRFVRRRYDTLKTA